MRVIPRGTRRRLHLISALVVLATSGLIVPGAVAQEGPTPISVITMEDLQLDVDPVDLANLTPLPGMDRLGFNNVEQRLLRGMTMDARGTEYGFGDDPTGVPLINPPGTSLRGIGNAQVRFDGPLDMPPSGTMSGDMLFLETGGGIMPGGDVTLIWFEFADPVDLDSGLAINEGVVFARPNVDSWMSSFAGDTWEGGYLFPTVTYNPNPFNLTAFRFEPPQSFPEEEFPGFVMRDGTMMIVGIETDYLTADGPLNELGYGLHLHWSDGPFAPGFVTTYPERVERTPESFPLVRTNPAFAPNTYVEPVSATTTTTTPTTTTTVAPTTTVAAGGTTETTVTTETTATSAPPTETTLPGGGNLEGGSLRIWVPILIFLGGLAIVVGGYWVYYRTRERPRPGTDKGDGGEEDPGDDPRDTPRPVIYGEEIEHPSCDWSVYFHDGTRWVPLRTPSIASHECCVYRIKVRTRIRGHAQAAKARQDAGDGRLQIPDYDFSWTGLNLDGHTSTRSGPRGRLDWMQGLGDPTEQADLASDDEYWQRAQGEEPPELAVHLEHREITRVEVKLEAGCPEYTNTYKGWGSSTLDVMATQECTNDDPAPECPVELNAFGWSWGEVWGDLNYWFGDTAGTDIDELEGAMRLREQLDPEEREDTMSPHAGHPMWDGHDHETRDRATYQASDGGTDTQTFEADRFVAWIVSEYELDSAQLVPVHVWPTTERVTTHIESGITHAIDVDGSMIPRNCDSNGCGGHGDCRCKPEFKIKFDAAVTTIAVDGKTFRIHRDPVSANRRTPPGTGGYRSWKLV